MDYAVALFIRENIHGPRLNRILSQINRGEMMLLLIIPYLAYAAWNHLLPYPWWIVIPYAGLIAYANDRSVLALKKIISRKRPLITVAGKVDQNPDMKHSFPSAHASNSMTAALVLVFLFGFPEWFLVLSLMAGIGRLLSLHHFPSDVIGGWVIGTCFGSLGLFLGRWLLPAIFGTT
ncbi:phosphatase PAP2 family protein [Leptospira langatensis]|uniref:Phosphatase PAP2 family protein n=1 Tax=Leptospira langatensis TaxID=2484983 RepID=A0A5F1ZVX9_9LEPT|nr:phosphatase PAP2 family protein [Leptospira langatensis]TGK03248.1 phosphatase PAP2 family protein [Leptospira langatensis]TGL42422.1 phosphatase PAP2 family protein [Leptospira langatensis]